MDFTKFRDNLAALMKSRKLTNVGLSAGTGMSELTIRRYLKEKNRIPKLDNIISLSEYFDVSVDWLLGLSDEKNGAMSSEHQDLIDCYTVASPEDRRVIQAVLSKYRKE